MGVWDTPMRHLDGFEAFQSGQAWGEREGGRIRNASAYRRGGLDEVANAAGEVGDMEGENTARTRSQARREFADESTMRAYDRLEKVRPFALGAINRARDLPVDQRAAWFAQPHIQQRFLDTGIPPEKYQEALALFSDPAQSDQALESFAGVYTQHQDPDWRPMLPGEMTDLPAGSAGDINPTTGQRRPLYRPPNPRAGDGNYADDGYDYEGN